MEDDLDRIAAGEQERVDWLRHFYFGGDDGDAGLHALVSDLAEIDARAVNSLPLGESGIVLRVGRYGPYVERGEERASVPEDMAPDELTVEKAEELLAAPSGDRALGAHPEWGTEIVAQSGRYGPYVTEVLPEDATEKPRTASLFQTMSPETVTLEEAVRLLSLPRVLGADPADGVEVTAQNGRYGPYVKKGAESRSLESEEQLFTITLDEALALLAKPKERRGRGQAKPPLRELGADPRQRQAGRAQGGPLRPLRHRRRDEREPPPRRRYGDGHARAGGGAARRPALEGAGAEAQAQRRRSARPRSPTERANFQCRPASSSRRARSDALAWYARKPISSPHRNRQHGLAVLSL